MNKKMTMEEAKKRFDELDKIPYNKRKKDEREEHKQLKELLEKEEDGAEEDGEGEETEPSNAESEETEKPEEEEEESGEEEMTMEEAKGDELQEEYKVLGNLRTGQNRYRPGDVLRVKRESLTKKDIEQLLASKTISK